MGTVPPDLSMQEADPRTDDLLARLYDEHGAPVYRYLLAMLGRREDAEDAMQTVWMNLCRRLPDADDPSAYLWRTARNEAWRHAGRSRRRSGHEAEEAALEMLPEQINPHVANGERAALVAALDRLPLKQREAVVLMAFEGLTAREAAERTGASENTAASRYRLAVAKLRRLLNRSTGT